MKIAERELRLAQNYNYIVVNDTVEEAVHEIEAIMVAEGLKVSNNAPLIAELNK